MGRFSYLLITLMFVLASCGGGDSSEKEPGTDQNTEEQEGIGEITEGEEEPATLADAKDLVAQARTVAGVTGISTNDHFGSFTDRIRLAREIGDGDSDRILQVIPMMSEAFALAANEYVQTDGAISEYTFEYNDGLDYIIVEIEEEDNSPIYIIDQYITVSEDLEVYVYVATEVEADLEITDDVDYPTTVYERKGTVVLDLIEGSISSDQTYVDINSGSFSIDGVLTVIETSDDSYSSSDLTIYSLNMDLEVSIEERLTEQQETITFTGGVSANIDGYSHSNEQDFVSSDEWEQTDSFGFAFDNLEITLSGGFSSNFGETLEATATVSMDADDGLAYGCADVAAYEADNDYLFWDVCTASGTGTASLNIGLDFLIDIENTDVDVYVDMDIQHLFGVLDGENIDESTSVDVFVSYKDSGLFYNYDKEENMLTISNGGDIWAQMPFLSPFDDIYPFDSVITDGTTVFADIVDMEGGGTKIIYSDDTMEIY